MGGIPIGFVFPNQIPNGDEGNCCRKYIKKNLFLISYFPINVCSKVIHHTLYSVMLLLEGMIEMVEGTHTSFVCIKGFMLQSCCA